MSNKIATIAHLRKWKAQLEKEISIKGDGIDVVLTDINFLLDGLPEKTELEYDDIVIDRIYALRTPGIPQLKGVKAQVIDKVRRVKGGHAQLNIGLKLLENTKTKFQKGDYIELGPWELEEI